MRKIFLVLLTLFAVSSLNAATSGSGMDNGNSAMTGAGTGTNMNNDPGSNNNNNPGTGGNNPHLNNENGSHSNPNEDMNANVDEDDEAVDSAGSDNGTGTSH